MSAASSKKPPNTRTSATKAAALAALALSQTVAPGEAATAGLFHKLRTGTADFNAAAAAAASQRAATAKTMPVYDLRAITNAPTWRETFALIGRTGTERALHRLDGECARTHSLGMSSPQCHDSWTPRFLGSRAGAELLAEREESCPTRSWKRWNNLAGAKLDECHNNHIKTKMGTLVPSIMRVAGLVAAGPEKSCGPGCSSARRLKGLVADGATNPYVQTAALAGMVLKYGTPQGRTMAYAAALAAAGHSGHLCKLADTTAPLTLMKCKDWQDKFGEFWQAMFLEQFEQNFQADHQQELMTDLLGELIEEFYPEVLAHTTGPAEQRKFINDFARDIKAHMITEAKEAAEKKRREREREDKGVEDAVERERQMYEKRCGRIHGPNNCSDLGEEEEMRKVRRKEEAELATRRFNARRDATSDRYKAYKDETRAHVSRAIKRHYSPERVAAALTSGTVGLATGTARQLNQLARATQTRVPSWPTVAEEALKPTPRRRSASGRGRRHKSRRHKKKKKSRRPRRHKNRSTRRRKPRKTKRR